MARWSEPEGVEGNPLSGPELSALLAQRGRQFAVDGDRRHLVELIDLMREHPMESSGQDVLKECTRGIPWLSGITGASEAAINGMRQLLGNGVARDAAIALNLSDLESPSAIALVRRTFPNLTVTIETVREPDIREPVEPVGVVVWAYQGAAASPAVPAPSATALTAVRDLTVSRWPSPVAAYDHAVTLSAIPIEDLVGVLVHLPEPDERWVAAATAAPDVWVRAVQVFACLGIAHHDTDSHWIVSRRRTILADLLNGPEDWVTDAAAFALLAVAWSEPGTRADVGILLGRRMITAVTARRTRVSPSAETLCHLTLACPWLDPEILELARSLLAAMTAQAENAEATSPLSSDADRPSTDSA